MLTFFLVASSLILIPGGLLIIQHATVPDGFHHYVWLAGVLLSFLGLGDFAAAVWVNVKATGGKSSGGER